MRLTKFHWLLLAIALSAAAVKGGAPTTLPASPAISDVTGTVRRPLELGSAKAAVIVFISAECPISNGYAPQVNRLCQAYESRGVVFYLVHADRDLSDADARKHAADYGYTCPVLIDRRHELVRQLGATVTPEAAVIGAHGELLYRGRIDDGYVSLGKRRFEATTHDLRDALEAVLAGKPVAAPRTATVGCAIGAD